MGLIEDMFGALSGGRAATEPWLAQAMHGLIGEAGSPGVAIAELLERLKQMGLGPTVRSWRGPGPYRPLDPADLHRALGDDAVREMATRAGLAPGDLIGKLSTHLPGVVAQLDEAGRLP